MKYRQLGRSGPEVSVVGLGGWPLSGRMGKIDEQTAIALVRASIDRGVTLVDTAQGYFTSEQRIGRALKDGYRDRCFLATKVSGNYTRSNIAAAMEASLKALDVDYVDLYQIHSWDPHCDLEEAMEAMARLQTEGKTRYIGVSNYSAGQMQRALKIAPFQSTQPVYNLFERGIESEDISFCKQEGIGILAHSPLAKGLLAGYYSPGHQFSSEDERSRDRKFQGERFARYLVAADSLKQIASDKGLTLPQLAIGWLLRDEAITSVLVGAKTVTQLDESVKAADARFSETELAQIEDALRNAELLTH